MVFDADFKELGEGSYQGYDRSGNPTGTAKYDNNNWHYTRLRDTEEEGKCEIPGQ